MIFFEALVLGIVEGITEFLPISSTGHLILVGSLLDIPQSDFVKSFEIAIQLGAILAVVFLYAKILLRNGALIKKVVVAFIPTAVIGLLFYKIVKQLLLGSQAVVLWMLALGGIALIIFELLHAEKKTAENELAHMSYKTALTVGLFQSIAIIPGVSRAAATIVGGLLCGLTRKSITEFSFLLAIPTMAAATGLDLLKNASSFSLNHLTILAVGFVSAFIVALFSVKFLLRFIKTHTFIAFGVYRVVIAIILWRIIYF